MGRRVRRAFRAVRGRPGPVSAVSHFLSVAVGSAGRSSRPAVRAPVSRRRCGVSAIHRTAVRIRRRPPPGATGSRPSGDLITVALGLTANLWQISHPTPTLAALYAQNSRWEHIALAVEPRLTRLLRATATGLTAGS
ncbi:hypothetical protein [Streptomyces cyaneofuscatus]|uniref:hypothetical protein n=1 Tax=Streptomyces cyaneofuscatus TaxID=66883 RepID=UPI0037AD118C